jgi:ribosomal protein S18 acetylase RimI-like enzyme
VFFSSAITRIADYYARHGFTATIRRVVLQVRRKLFAGRMAVFYCDLNKSTSPLNTPSSLKLERLRTFPELSPADLQAMTSFWSPKQALRNIRERFDKGATLWLIRSGKRVAGYGWTLQGRTIEPYYFPLGSDDVHLFDFHVYPEFRGRGINPLLVRYILASLATETDGRAFIEAAEWNQAQLASLKKTPFRRMGLVRTATLFGNVFSCWRENQPVQEDTGERHQPLAVARSRER